MDIRPDYRMPPEYRDRNPDPKKEEVLMATRIIKNYAEGLGPKDPRTIIQEWFASAIADADHASEVDDAIFYEGQADALENVLKLLNGEDE